MKKTLLVIRVWLLVYSSETHLLDFKYKSHIQELSIFLKALATISIKQIFNIKGIVVWYAIYPRYFMLIPYLCIISARVRLSITGKLSLSKFETKFWRYVFSK